MPSQTSSGSERSTPWGKIESSSSDDQEKTWRLARMGNLNPISYKSIAVGAVSGEQFALLSLGELEMSAPTRDTPPVVEVPTVGRVASGVVFVVSVLSLLVGFLSGFNMIYAPMAILITWFAGFYYFISTRIANKWKNK